MGVFGSTFGEVFAQKGSTLNQEEQVIINSMLTEEGNFYMQSEDEQNVYLQLETL